VPRTKKELNQRSRFGLSHHFPRRTGQAWSSALSPLAVAAPSSTNQTATHGATEAPRREVTPPQAMAPCLFRVCAYPRCPPHQ
jgi:hypothetical protein